MAGCCGEHLERAVQAVYLLRGAAEDPTLADAVRAKLREAIDKVWSCDNSVVKSLLEVEAPSHIRFIIRQVTMILTSIECSKN